MRKIENVIINNINELKKQVGSDLLTIEFEDNQYPVSKTSLKKMVKPKSITIHTVDKTASIKIDGYQE